MERSYPHFVEPTLREHVEAWISDKTEDYDGDRNAVIDDLMYGGCQSGMVGHLIYHTETNAFYQQYQKEIDAMLKEIIDETGMPPQKIFNHIGWDEEDPLAREPTNQTILAWFGFEEMARQIDGR